MLNIAERAVVRLMIDNEMVSFSARFSGTSYPVQVPISAVLAVYARETGQGMALPDDIPGNDTARPAMNCCTMKVRRRTIRRRPVRRPRTPEPARRQMMFPTPPRWAAFFFAGFTGACRPLVGTPSPYTSSASSTSGRIWLIRAAPGR